MVKPFVTSGNSLTGKIAQSLNLSKEEFSAGLRVLAKGLALASFKLPPLAPAAAALEIASAASDFNL